VFYGRSVPERPPLIDLLLAAAFVVLVVAEAEFSSSVVSPREHLLVAGTAMAGLAWRRQFPVLVATAVVAANLLLNPQGLFSTLLSLVLVCFTLGVDTAPPRSYVGLGIVMGSSLLYSALHTPEPSDVAAAIVFMAGPWTVGVVLRGQIASAEQAVARAGRLERERELEAARAAAEERTRIARELHDIVAHSISVITIQAQAVRRRLGPDHAREAADLAAVESTARQAQAEMRRIFGVLRAEGESLTLAPQPGLAELDRLVSQVGAGDMEVVLRVEGEAVPLSPGIDLAAYRIAQEGLTNAARHSDARRVQVLVRYAPDRLDVEVEDDGRGLPQTSSGGHGLVGVRERVALYGGDVELGASSCGGVRLAARLPLQESR
jgi:signal transduction histidine kinase